MSPEVTVRTNEFFIYRDSTGQHGAEADAYVVTPLEVVVVECKLTGCEAGHSQILNLYAPILTHLYRKPVRGLQVCRNCGPSTPGPFVDDAVEFILNSRVPLATLLWRPNS